MSTFRAIAGVSRTLRNLLRDRMEDPAAATVAIAPPDVSVTGVPGNRLTLYLFQITENGNLANQEIPGQGYPGSYGLPPLSIDLHYLLTAFGQPENGPDADLQAQLILGDAMRVLHDLPIVTDALAITRPAVGPVGSPILDPSLLGQFEKLKICLAPTSLEDLSRIWSALPDANFRRSVAYEVTVVQIESRRPRRRPHPVLTRRVHLSPISRPEVTAVYRTPAGPADPVGDARARILDQLTLEGRGFVAPRTWVRLGGLEPIQLDPRSDEEIVIQIPDATYPADADHPAPRPIPAGDRLQPGPQVVQVLVRTESDVVEGGLDHGTVTPATDAAGSNQLAFTLVPRVGGINPATGTTASLLTVTGTRLFQEGRRSQVLVGDLSIEVRKPGPTDPWAAPTPTQVQVSLSPLADVGLPPGTYPVGVVASGARSIEDQPFQLT